MPNTASNPFEGCKTPKLRFARRKFFCQIRFTHRHNSDLFFLLSALITIKSLDSPDATHIIIV